MMADFSEKGRDDRYIHLSNPAIFLGLVPHPLRPDSLWASTPSGPLLVARRKPHFLEILTLFSLVEVPNKKMASSRKCPASRLRTLSNPAHVEVAAVAQADKTAGHSTHLGTWACERSLSPTHLVRESTYAASQRPHVAQAAETNKATLSSRPMFRPDLCFTPWTLPAQNLPPPGPSLWRDPDPGPQFHEQTSKQKKIEIVSGRGKKARHFWAPPPFTLRPPLPLHPLGLHPLGLPASTLLPTPPRKIRLKNVRVTFTILAPGPSFSDIGPTSTWPE